ncbi:platelet binding protein GspB isoform X1 [Drosophila virilis]|uniref:platelet binding protein GspB isoform X1 n=1 Tax=Drosophila virilis TaxID=7244 RepID=UPI0013963849|nr:serine-rich adhesin for platelets isoform X1 [Drosophila virilis]XP_032293462.1 serine-rich adhesin for platelets isoform X1 [Drosophila virilis]XP_032293463.1 serine-rich adhesin for platelets isoform X1 [Drosophila virilis]XP_032293464.1 serine-rich adhesin for platelets isoform X1 [Drosophila virilis]
MEVATTNNHSQSHHHHHLSGGSGGAGGGGNGGSRSPFQREVREWQRIDPDTGALFSGRLEADRWINGPLNSYGKISDSQNISQPNGTQHTQRKQMEVLRTANGAMQVIRTQTVQKTSSTSRWSTSSSTKTTTRSSTGAAPMALFAPRTSQGVDICELRNDDDDDDDDDKHNDYVDDGEDSIHNGSDAGVVHECTTASMPSTGYGQELVDDHVDFVVINGHADVDDAADDDDDDDNDVAHLHKLGHNLLLDTAPSLKLSNLMKSSSSISSQSSNNSNLTTAAATAAAAAAAAGNTHRNAGKISLHAIVGQTTTTTSTAAAATATSSSSGTLSTWPQRLEQADLYGQANNNNNNSSKRRVGVAADVAAVATPTLRRDLESFRHHDDAATAADDDVDEDLRLSARHQRRQQVSQSVYAPPLPASFGSLQRSRSISTDDLSNDWQQRGEEQTEEELPCGDWRRVSKLRRSFQSQDYHNKTQSRPRPLPLDLPSSTVSVARIRAELENGRRLNTAMRNNHVDLAALDSILNTTAAAVSAAGAAAAAAASATAQSSSKPQLAKRSTFLTAASLQEIRGKLKKLSDESLYKEDFLAHQAIAQPAAVEVVQAPVPAPSTPSAFRVVHNTHSLETRQRPKDSSSSEWHLRRKSYGFEKMSPPENRSIFRVDASTDSGLGRSGEQLGNWSPTERSAAAAANGAGSTIIHFGRQQVGKPASPSEAEQLSKRHSIAVEETWRDIRKTSQVHVNGDSINGSNGNNSASQLQRSSAQKRVEFCKTEVHFAAESGRVNIVETDGKPPPTQNFRRRRRTASGPLQSLVKSASVTSSSSSSSSSNVTHFGDDPTVRNKTIASSTVAYRATLMEPPELVTQPVAGTQVTVITKPLVEPRYSLLETTSSTSRHSYTSTSGVDTTDNETDELANIRGILKNKPVKPKPYHLGENIESADVLWSVPATIKSDNRENSPPSRESAAGDSPITTKSVAERVRIVEQRQFDKQKQPSPAGNGYSTKINVSLGADDWSETGRRRSSAQELLLQDLRAHQRILDEGLKSTSLIMKTMRSASEFDEAMRRLSIASIESALIQPTIVVPTPMLRSHSYQEESCRRTSTTSITSSDLFGSALYDSLPRTPLAPPRLKLLGNTQIPVSQQLTQLRRLYDAADQEEDSADEEVKRYFRESNNSDSGGGTQCSSSPEDTVLKGTEYSSSWSRLKAKRTIWKIEAQEQTIQRTDLPKSNVMNIALHAPRLQKPKPTPPTLRIGQLVPVAKPRTLLVQPQPQAPVADNADESGSESLKIVKEARGARKLREHELSYFGVQHSPTPTQTTKLHVTPSNPRRTLPTRNKLSHNEEATTATTSTTTTTTKWQLLNDRPDLLRHSPQANDESNAFPEDDEEHFYENIANELTTTFRVKSPSPGSYERKTDLQRDAQILSEMTRNADQTMKALSDEAAFKDQRRRSCSLQRRSAKPLATIDEKVKTHNGDAKALSVARGTFASEARRNSRQSTPSPTRARSSSQSSIECCPRDRSRSSSRESMTQGGGSSDEQLSKQRVERIRMRTPKREKTRHETTDQRSSRQSSKPRSSSNATPESKRTHHHSRHREKEHNGEHSAKHSSGSASGSRLLRSTRVSETSRPRTSSHRTSERERERERERTSGTEKHREELTRSRGHSSRSRHSEQSAAGHKSSKSSRSNHHDTAMSAHRKSTTAAKVAATKATMAATATTHKSTTTPTTATATTTAPTAAATTTTHNELTYVYVTNLAHTQTAEDADYASIDEATVTVTPTALPAIPLPPPRRKRKRSLLPVPVQREGTTATPTVAYEHRIKLEMIPQTPSYSNQSTLRCKQQPMRKSSLKCTQSTSSSFAFLPYLPAKRNSSVSHVYDNYLLYAAPATLTASKLRPYQHNLSNEHAQLFGSSGRGGGIVSSGAATGNGATGALAGRLGSWPKRLRMRQVRSSVSTHQPFGICTCS